MYSILNKGEIHMCKDENCNRFCGCCLFGLPDDLDHETLEVIYWCGLHHFETSFNSTCSDFKGV